MIAGQEVFTSKQLTKLNKIKCKSFCEIRKVMAKSGDVLETAGKILLIESPAADPYYDLYTSVAVAMNSKSDMRHEEVFCLISNFTMQVNEWDYVCFIRYLILNGKCLGAGMITYTLSLNNLVLDFYKRGAIACVDNERGVVYRDSFFDSSIVVSPLDAALITMWASETCGFKSKVRVKRYDLSTKDLERVVGLFKCAYGSEFEGVLEELKTLDLTPIVMSSSSCINVTQIASLYDVNCDRSHLYDTWQWEREDFLNGTSSYAQAVDMTMVAVVDCDKLLQHRKYYVRDKGVEVVFTKTMDDISSLHVKEVHHFGTIEGHYLMVAATTTKGVVRKIVLNLDNFEESTKLFLYEVDYTIMLLVLSWLGLLESVKDSVKSMSLQAFKKHYTKNKDVTESDLELLVTVAAEILSSVEEFTAEDNIRYVEPYNWNYDLKASTGNKVSVNDTGFIKKMVSVGRHTRELPEGWNASVEAKDLAKKYRIELDEGKTLVDDFTRNQKMKIF